MKTPFCKFCEHWILYIGEGYGRCHRFPPSLSTDAKFPKFPATDPNEHCGEFAERMQYEPRSESEEIEADERCKILSQPEEIKAAILKGVQS